MTDPDAGTSARVATVTAAVSVTASATVSVTDTDTATASGTATSGEFPRVEIQAGPAWPGPAQPPGPMLTAP